MSDDTEGHPAAEEERKVPRKRPITKASMDADDGGSDAPDMMDENDTTRYQGLSTAVAVPDGPTTRVHVAKNHTLHRNNGTSVTYTADGTNCDGEPGEYEMPTDDAEHWFVQAHLVDQPPPMIPPAVGSPAHIQQLQSAQARMEAVHAALSQEEQMALDEARDARMTRARRALGPAVERTEP